MNQTEQTTLEQFQYWHGALKLDLEPAKLEPNVGVVVIGCGTSYYLTQTIAASMNANGLEAIAVSGGEWNLRREQFVPNGKQVQILALSRSGETTETVAAAKQSLDHGERVYKFDGMINEECFQFNGCETLKPFKDLNKPIFVRQYGIKTSAATYKAGKYNGTSSTRNQIANQLRLNVSVSKYGNGGSPDANAPTFTFGTW